MNVVRFQPTKITAPVIQKPRRCWAGSSCVTDTAVDSSIVSWAAATRRSPRTCRIGLSCSP